GQIVRVTAVRRRRSRIPASAGRSQRRKPRGHRESLAADHRVPQTAHQVVRAAFLTLALSLLGSDPNGTTLAPLGSDPNGLRADIKFLSSDLLEGRAP